MHNTENVSATVKKNIAGYNYDKGKYYLITNPLTSAINPETASINHLTSGNYDLYYWFVDIPDEFKWRNYKKNTFMLSPDGDGYLYANQRGVELSFPGTLKSSRYRYGKTVSYNSNDSEHPGWNLIGNPFMCNAYLVDENGNPLPYYKMNAAGRNVEATVSGVIAPVESVFYETSGNGYVYFTRNAPAKKNGKLKLFVGKSDIMEDNVVIVFGEGQKLGKVNFCESGDNLYISQDGKDYAVVNANKTGEMPICFKAETDGDYTLSFTNEEVEFSYLHLIDNLAGTDIDLLALQPFDGPQEPQAQGSASYTFEAKTTDNANRFKLVFEIK